jgi:hypothetical protein
VNTIINRLDRNFFDRSRLKIITICSYIRIDQFLELEFSNLHLNHSLDNYLMPLHYKSGMLGDSRSMSEESHRNTDPLDKYSDKSLSYHPTYTRLGKRTFIWIRFQQESFIN